MDLLGIIILAGILFIPSGVVVIMGLIILRAIWKLKEDLVGAGLVEE